MQLSCFKIYLGRDCYDTIKDPKALGHFGKNKVTN